MVSVNLQDSGQVHCMQSLNVDQAVALSNTANAAIVRHGCHTDNLLQSNISIHQAFVELTFGSCD